MQSIRVEDSSFKQDDKAVGGVILLLADKNFERASPKYWKTKQIERVCHSSKDAETLVLNRMVEDTLYAARQIEVLLYGSYERRLPIHLYTDSEGTLESITSTKQVDRKSLHMVVQDLKERLLEEEIGLFQWIPTKSM